MLDKRVVTEKKKMSMGAMTIVTLVTIVLIVVGIVVVLRMIGRGKVEAAIEGTGEGMTEIGETISANNAETVSDSENRILYNGREYVYNEDMITILVMGIDKETVNEVGGQSWDAAEGDTNTGGQADALFLLLINPHKENISIVAINRNTMTDVDVWNEDGDYEGTYVKQIALQHGYGDGGVESCERQVRTVSRLFHGIPINAYAAISMDALPELNDAVGGITVEVLDDIIYPEYDMDLHQGDTVTLYGDKAYWYVRLRNENIFNSNELRLQRQKQYLTTFAATAKKMAMSDIRVATSLYGLLQKYMVTDIDLSSFTYLATEYIGYDFSSDHIYSLTGEVIQGNLFEEFYADEDALEALIVELFYEPVE